VSTFTYRSNGLFEATLKVTDPSGRSASASVQIIVGNTAPVVELTTSPAPGEPFAFSDTVTWQVTVTDPEDGQIDCSRGSA
jgi:cytochrome c